MGDIAKGGLSQYVERGIDNAVPDGVKSLLHDTGANTDLYKYAAIACTVLVLLLFCAVCALRKNWKLLIALLKHASKVIRQIPSLLVFPLALLCSIALSGTLLTLLGLMILTAQQEKVNPTLEKYFHSALDFAQAQNVALILLAIGYLWVYFFHIALFTAMVAYVTCHWLLAPTEVRNRVRASNILGKPICVSAAAILRY